MSQFSKPKVFKTDHLGDLRGAPRFKFGAQNAVVLVDKKTGKFLDASGMDVSERGIGVELKGIKSKLSEVELKVGDITIPLTIKWSVNIAKRDHVNRYGFMSENPQANILLALLSAGYDIDVEFHEEDLKAS